VLHKMQLDENKVIFHTVILWEQCNKLTRVKVKGTDGYETTKGTNDCLDTQNHLGVCLNYESSHANTLERYIVFRQEGKSNDDYFKAFNSLVSMYEHFGDTEIKALVDASTHDKDIAQK